MGIKATKLLTWIFPTSSDEPAVIDDVQNRELCTEENEEFLDIWDEEQRLRGCKVGDRIIPVGTCWTDRKKCIYYQCRDFNQLTEIHCPEGCAACAYRRCKEVPGDPEKDYPDCCSTVVCEPPKFNTFAELEALGDLCDDPQQCL